MTSKELAPLQSALDSILSRLSCLESKVGVSPPASPPATGTVSQEVDDDEIAPALKAYDEHVDRAVKPFVNACNGIDGLKDTGSHIDAIWKGTRDIVEIGTKCKKPGNVQTSLMPFLKPVQDAMTKIRQARLDRKYDWHIKAIMEMLTCVSWTIMSAPPAPSAFIKESIGSTDFWANKIRKEYKGKDAGQIAFCDTMKQMIQDLAAYVKEYHLSGLMWNPKGIDTSDYSASTSAQNPTPTPTPAVISAPAPAAGGVSSLMKELSLKKSKDGSSAATGLKKVSREQQTWRKEFKGGKLASAETATAPVKPSAIKAAQTSVVQKKRKEPVCSFQPVQSKWIVENQTKESNPNGVCVIEVKSPKEQVYIYNCEHATIQVKGKLKSVILDSCTKTNLVFETAISSCELVNCKRMQIQSTGSCPSYSIDKTDGCLIYLSAEAASVSNFVTSKSSEMNVSWTDEKTGEQKEAPIPEQFVHRLVDGVISSDVSDLYH